MVMPVSNLSFLHVNLVWFRFKLTTLVMIATNCIGSCKSNYHAIKVTTAPKRLKVFHGKMCILL